MSDKLSVATQRKILKLESRIFKLEQEKVRLKAKHKREVAKLEAENQKLRDQPIVVSEEQRMRLIELNKRLMKKDPNT